MKILGSEQPLFNFQAEFSRQRLMMGLAQIGAFFLF
jgi:hypothetical protein